MTDTLDIKKNKIKQPKDKVVQRADNVDDVFQRLFVSLDTEGNGYISKEDIINVLEKRGIIKSDQRIAATIKELDRFSRSDKITLSDFVGVTQRNISIIERAIEGNLIIPDFDVFAEKIKEIHDRIIGNEGGDVARYIPQLARVNPDQLGISVCTIDGQVFSQGNTDIEYCIQSTCKPINYCIALEKNGEEKVHQHVGREPSGRSFNEITLNRQNRPHNPMINAGAIMCSSLIEPKLSLADRFDNIIDVWEKLSGDVRPGYNNSVYHSEKSTADRNFALAHFMREVGAFPEGVDLEETLDFYFQCCSIEVTADSMATIAASFANAGVCPKTGTKVFSPDTVKNCLSLMYSCGMYDFSGEFAFSVGVPAKSGVSGALMIVIPNVMGIAVWSPRLDEMGNSVRGVDFCKELVNTFNFHNYDSLVGQSTKMDPRHKTGELQAHHTFTLVWAASQGDLDEIQRLVALNVDLNRGDYDGRTALHLAAAEGQLETVEFLLNKRVNVNPKDRWGNTPIKDAKRHKHSKVISLLEEHGAE